MRSELAALILDALPPAQRGWLERERDAVRGAAGGADALALAFAGSARRARGLPEDARRRAAAMLAASGASRGFWSAAAVLRATLLLEAADACSPGPLASSVQALFVRGDNEERKAILQTLAVLPSPAALVELAVEACRTNVQDVFEALACENPYPARFFGDAAFNQMVLKSVFLGIAVARVEGLQGRLNDDLARMAEAYARERREAGRSVPADLVLLGAGTR